MSRFIWFSRASDKHEKGPTVWGRPFYEIRNYKMERTGQKDPPHRDPLLTGAQVLAGAGLIEIVTVILLPLIPPPLDGISRVLVE